MSVTAVLLAAGSGERAGGLPKQFLDIAGLPMVWHSLEAMEACPEIEAVVLVVPSSASEDTFTASKVCSVTQGGPTRQASLSEGIVCLPENTSMVLVHDAARPLATPQLFTKVIAAVGSASGAVCGIPLDDALKEVSESGEIVSHRSRIGMWRAQTPQVFEREALEDSLARADAAGLVADDCSEMLLKSGYKVRSVRGEPWNLKVTTLDDLRLCEMILNARAAIRP